MARLFLIISMTLLVFTTAKTLFSQEPEEQQYDELAVVMSGLSPEQFTEMSKKLGTIEQKLVKTLRDAGYTTMIERDTLDDQLDLFSSAIGSLAPEIESTIKSVISSDEYRVAQERVLIFSQYADYDQVTDIEELAAIAGTIMQLDDAFNPSAILAFSPDQQKAYQYLKKENLKAMGEMQVSMDEMLQEALESDKTILELRKKLENTTDEKEKDVLQEQFSKTIHEKMMSIVNDKITPKFRELLKKSRDGLQKILTSEQKAKLGKMKENMPESLWKIMPGNYGKERPWRPGEHSWQPGMGAPDDLGNSLREMKPAPKERGRRFPGAD